MPFTPAIAVKLSGSVTSDPANITAATVLAHTFSVPGAKTGDLVVVTAPALEANLGICGARVSANNTVEVRIVNPTAGAINPASQEFRYMIF